MKTNASQDAGKSWIDKYTGTQGLVSNNLFSPEKKNINVIIYCGYEGIEELVFASSDDEETINKMRELKSIASAEKMEADKYTEEEKEKMLDSNDVEKNRRFATIFNHKDPDRYCVMSFVDGRFKCTCAELGVAPEKPWLY